MPRQLNIRSDEAHATAHLLAERLGCSTTQVVTDALREYSSRRLAPSAKTTPAQARADWLKLKKMIDAANRDRSREFTSDHSDLYDDDGLPI